MFFIRNYVFAFLLISSGLSTTAVADQQYQNADEAWGVGVAFYNSRNFAASREPFEAALKLAPDDKFRLKVYEALIPSYRLLGEPGKMFEATEFILDHHKSTVRQSLIRRSLIGFSFQRGKIDQLITRHEKRLENNAEDRTSLSVLAEIYSRAKRDPKKSAEYLEKLAKLELKQGVPLNVLRTAELARQYVSAQKYAKGAELYEKIAPLDDDLAAWHWKEAAAAWLREGNKEKGLAAAKKSAACAPEKRSEQLTYYWHKAIADVFLATDEDKLAGKHFELAIKHTKIEGYIKSCEKGLEQALQNAN